MNGASRDVSVLAVLAAAAFATSAILAASAASAAAAAARFACISAILAAASRLARMPTLSTGSVGAFPSYARTAARTAIGAAIIGPRLPLVPSRFAIPFERCVRAPLCLPADVTAKATLPDARADLGERGVE